MTRGLARRPGRPTNAERAAREGAEGDVVRALADATRRRILLLVAKRPMAVHEIAERFDVSRPMISKQLKRLGDAGLVEAETSGRERLYALRKGPRAKLALQIAKVDAEYAEALGKLRERLGQG